MLKGNFPIEQFVTQRTPFYYYDMELLGQTLRTIRQEMSLMPDCEMHYAVKANFNPRILRAIAAAGFGADCVSGGEIKAALAAGFPSGKIVFAGVGKSDEEIVLGLEKGISRFNVESAAELEVINAFAAARGVKAPVSIRVNPDIGAHTHANITTGLAENKFGINLEQLDEIMELVLSLPAIEYKGLHFHIGSQITDMSDFVALCNRINNIQDDFEHKGVPVGDINVGGGLGINYEHPNHLPLADFHSYFETFRRHLVRRHGQTLHFELGRSIVAPCGSLICKVLYVKEGTHKRFAIVDGSMTELLRPALYHAYHRIEHLGSPLDSASAVKQPGDVTGAEPLSKVSEQPELLYDVVGPVCESSDVFAKAVSLPQCRRGDYVAIRSAGAYGESMSSGYNCHELPGSFFDGEPNV